MPGKQQFNPGFPPMHGDQSFGPRFESLPAQQPFSPGSQPMPGQQQFNPGFPPMPRQHQWTPDWQRVQQLNHEYGKSLNQQPFIEPFNQPFTAEDHQKRYGGNFDQREIPSQYNTPFGEQIHNFPQGGQPLFFSGAPSPYQANHIQQPFDIPEYADESSDI
ncbi:hypothetical protein CUU64_03920 [Bacillus sp. V5-8f]|nr:hypothetical protein CUU64_03920 [Bacillus sp. V5-8f]